MNEEEIFHEALARKHPEERVAYLDKACAGDTALRAQVEALLRANVGATGFLDDPALGPAATIDDPISERPGTAVAESGGRGDRVRGTGMRLCNFIVRDAIIPSLSVPVPPTDARDPAAVRKVKEAVVREMVAALHAATGAANAPAERVQATVR